MNNEGLDRLRDFARASANAALALQVGGMVQDAEDLAVMLIALRGLNDGQTFEGIAAAVGKWASERRASLLTIMHERTEPAACMARIQAFVALGDLERAVLRAMPAPKGQVA